MRKDVIIITYIGRSIHGLSQYVLLSDLLDEMGVWKAISAMKSKRGFQRFII